MLRFKRINIEDKDLKRVQDNCAVTFDTIIINPLLSGIIVYNISLETGKDNYIEHKLDRDILGWILTNKNADANIYESSTVNKLKSSYIILKTTANVTVSLFVF